ncbi:flagellar biosynthetic protein FliR [Ferribacterium limneticum]|uniref:flagellar biosynthetic protein FliR n=1 Tax=Ferribacterium limneticum TaxID=76259 RepID=UPI001CFBA37D|nr:flagellar biosynthetic protein FliR [Ferribacterium limneticum]UCV27661.1 flagellar biosynthetic protein FliR [Ferribacterium limneticum]UCV31578.1 flagellar biosynthetic protein FliR [Ferribacterium limneticum]
MISIGSAQIDAWIVAFVFPLARILGFIATAPLWGTAGIPRRTRLILAISIAVAITPTLPPMPSVQPGSLSGLWILAQQMLIGIGMGFAAKIVFTAFDLAGEFIGAQMGLGFATFYDPLNSSQTPVIAEFINLIALLLFLSMNGHLLYLATLAQSFSAIPVSATPLGAASWLNLAELGSKIFSAGLLLSLPIVVALMITNVALAVLTRAAPQLNLFALGFPLTLMGGFVALAISLNYLASPLQGIFEFGMSAMLGFATTQN